MSKPEILAPAGSMETLIAALRSGADAVYIGGKQFSARNSASNFTNIEISEASVLCHKYGAKLYLAVNTVITDDEAEDFCDYIKFTASAGIDAYIVQDIGCAELIRRCVPDAVLHASTQMSVHTAAGAAMLKTLGFTRVVPARELDRNAIEKICREDIETEIFVHGALCMSVSGQCYMSSVIGSRSANRGCCGQACRLPFSASENKNAAALSLKDLSLLPDSVHLAEIGVDSLKIEGRMKRPEYVASAVSELKKSLEGQAPDMALLKGIFSRSGFTNGYFSGERRNMFGIREKEDVTAAKELIPKIHELYRFERRVHGVNFHAVIKNGMPTKITAECCGISIEIQGDIPEKAMNRPTDIEMLRKQLSRLGDTVFFLEKITAEIDDGLIVPAGKLNEMRRNITERLTENIIHKNTPRYQITEYSPRFPEKTSDIVSKKLPVRIFCRNLAQVKTAAQMSEFLIIPEEIISNEVINIVGADKIIASPPRFISNEEKVISRMKTLKDIGIDRIFCHTLDSAAIGKSLGLRLHGSFTLNVCNSFAAEKLKEIGFEDCIFSFEPKLDHFEKVRTTLPIGALIYGKIPLMLTRNCPIKNEIGCSKCHRTITDRTGRKLPVVCSKDYVEILNTDVLYMSDRLAEFGNNIRFGYVILNDENEEQTKRVIAGFKPSGNITRGLYYRGI